MLHEDFYSSGDYVNHDLGLLAGFISADPARSPKLTWDDSGEVGCFVSGEPIVERSDPGRSSDPAFVLASLYKALGLGALENVNGWFSGILVDLRHRQTVLFNDRYGLNRIYVREQDNRLFFSSEAKSLLAVLPKLRELDVRGLAEWFSCGCPLENRTLFRGISLLPAASAWIFAADGVLKKERYFHPSTWENQAELPVEEYNQRLTKLFPRILKRYTNGTEPVAMSLTGGLDGRMIMAWAGSNPGALPCYTFNGSYRDCADVRIARKVAAVCAQPHQTISVGAEFLGQFPRLAEQTVRITDGAMDVSATPGLYVNRLARQIAPVRLTGNYGSEILRRHIAFKPCVLSSKIFSPDFGPQLAAAAGTYSEQAQGSRLSFIAFKQMPWHHYARLAIEQSQISIRSPFLDNNLVALAFRAPRFSSDSSSAPCAVPVVNSHSLDASFAFESSMRLISAGNAELSRIPTDRGLTWPAQKWANRLQREYHEFWAKAEYTYDYGMPQWLAQIDRKLSALRLEKLFLGRQKYYHFRTWYRHQLASYVKDILLDLRSRSRFYLNRAALEPLVNGHVSGLRNYTIELHKLLSLELLQRTLLD
jgi:asparagine synthase (glutamine-hydrolysing)